MIHRLERHSTKFAIPSFLLSHNSIGVRVNLLSWFAFDLTNKHMVVKIGHQCLNNFWCLNGVPQVVVSPAVSSLIYRFAKYSKNISPYDKKDVCWGHHGVWSLLFRELDRLTVSGTYLSKLSFHFSAFPAHLMYGLVWLFFNCIATHQLSLIFHVAWGEWQLPSR